MKPDIVCSEQTQQACMLGAGSSILNWCVMAWWVRSGRCQSKPILSMIQSTDCIRTPSAYYVCNHEAVLQINQALCSYLAEGAAKMLEDTRLVPDKIFSLGVLGAISHHFHNFLNFLQLKIKHSFRFLHRLLHTLTTTTLYVAQ